MAIYDFFVSRNGAVSNTAAYIGHAGRLFYDSSNGVVKLSDGTTPGGTPIPYTIATSTIVGGIKAGPGANVSVDGTLTIDTAGLPLGIGNLQINNTTLSVVNVNDDLILASSGTGNVNIVGNLNVYKTDGNIDSRQPEFSIASDGQVRIRVPTTDPVLGAVEIIGSNSSATVAPAVAGVMLHVTGNNNEFSTIYNDGINNFSNYIGRRYNGTALSPTSVLSGNTICRFSGTGYGATTFAAGASASISMVALENFTDSAQGTKIEFLAAPIGSITRETIANVTVAEGITTTKAKVLGNLTVLGNIIGNATTTTATIGTADVTTLNVGGNIRINGTNATGNGFNKAGGVVTANGQTGQITSLADSIAKNAAATFTINNNYINYKDVVIINIASGGTINSYAATVTRVANAFCNVTVTNSGTGSLAEALTFNFAVIKCN